MYEKGKGDGKMRNVKRMLALAMAGVLLFPPTLSARAAGVVTPQVQGEEAGESTTETRLTVEARYSSNHIRFQKQEGATGYYILRGNSATGTFTRLNETPLTISGEAQQGSYVDEDAGVGTQRWYKVEAVMADGNVETAAVQDRYQTGIMAVQEHAEEGQFHKDFTEDMEFSNRVVEASAEEVAKIASLKEGSILLTYRPSATSNRAAILSAKAASVTTPASGDITGNQMAVFQQGANIRLDWASTLRGTFSNAASTGVWHTYGAVHRNFETGKRTVYNGWNGSTPDGWGWENVALANFMTRISGLNTLTIGGVKNGDAKELPFSGEIAYVTITDEVLSQEELGAYTRAVTQSLRGDNMTIQELMADESYVDNHWVITGGEAVSAGYEHVGAIRNYVGQFEEYIRWARIDGSAINKRQRYVFNTGMEGRDLAETVQEYDRLVTAFGPRVVTYMVGVEDYEQGEDAIPEFKDNLRTFINRSLALKEAQKDITFVVIQKPFAVQSAETNAMIQKYCDAVDAVKAEYASTTKASRVIVVDHFGQTKDNDAFKNSKLTAEGKLTVDGHYEIAKQLGTAAFGNSNNFWGSWLRQEGSRRTAEPMATQYLTEVVPQAEAGAGSLQVSIPEGHGNVWKYQLTVDDVVIRGSSQSKDFQIPNLPTEGEYLLTVCTEDGVTQLATVMGSLEAGETSVVYVQERDDNQERIQELLKKDSLTWLFMGDSITHGAQFTAGYDSVPQLFEKFVRDGLGRKEDIILNSAVANGNTITTMQHIKQRLEKFTPDVVSIMLGTNDAVPGVAAIDVYDANMREIIRRIKQLNPEAVIILRTPTYSWDNNHITTVPAYTERLRRMVEEDESLIFIDQLTWGERYVGTYNWLTTRNGQYLYSDTVHPDANGHLIMFRQFVKGVGLWTWDQPLTNLSYTMPIEEEEKEVTPTLNTEETGTIRLSTETLRTQSGVSDLGAVILSAVSKTTGQSFETEAEHDDTEAVLTGLPIGDTYTVSVASYRKTAAKKLIFTAQDVLLEEGRTPNPPTPDLDLSGLEEAIAEAEAKQEDAYTAASWEALQQALTQARNVKEQDDAEQSAVDQAEEALREALEGLAEKADLSSLEEAIAEAEAKQEDAYTAASWEALQQALTQAGNVKEQDDAEQSAVDQAEEALREALEGLQEKQTTAAPEFSLAAGTYTGTQEVTITSATADAVIYYTTDGSDPTRESTVYSTPVQVSASMTLKALAVKDDMKDSEIAEAAYVIKAQEKPWIFDDVRQDGSWKHKAVSFVYNEGMMSTVGGTSNFYPDEPLQRAMLATILHRWQGTPAPTIANPFNDLKQSKYYYQAVIWAKEKGIVSGMGGTSTFAPEDQVSRQQIAKMLYEYGDKVLGLKLEASGNLNEFTDTKAVAAWAVTYMQWATGNGIITGKPNDAGKTSFRLDPDANATRAECAAMLQRFADKYVK